MLTTVRDKIEGVGDPRKAFFSRIPIKRRLQVSLPPFDLYMMGTILHLEEGPRRLTMLRFISGLLVCSLVLGLAPRQAAAQARPAGRPAIHILVIEGEGAINNMKQRTAREPIVEVRDENDKPVAGAVVVFTLPNVGPSGSFANGANVLTVSTDSTGRAVGAGLRPNGIEGPVQVKVNASYLGQTTSTTINMTNAMGAGTAAAAGGGSAKLIGILVGVGAAAGVGVALGLRGGNGSTPSPGPAPRPPTSISVGPGNVGAQP